MKNSNVKIKVTLLIFAIAIVTVAFLAVVANAFRKDESGTISAPLDKAPVIAVFKNDTLSDMARLLRPLDISIPSAPNGMSVISLRDAIYIGASDGNAHLLTVWLTNSTTENTNLLIPDDATKQLPNVAKRLAADSLSGVSFVVMLVDVGWKDWVLTVSRSGSVLVKATSAAVSTQLQTAILRSSTNLAQANTKSISVPIGYGLTKQTAIQPWFYGDQIVINILPIPAGGPAGSPPDISALNGKAGFLVGQDFFNNVFAYELKDKLFSNQKTESYAEGIYHVQDLESEITDGKLTITGEFTESPSGKPTKLFLDFTGDDLGPTNFGFKMQYPETSEPDFHKINMAVLRRKINLLLFSPTKVRPEGQQTLGNFLICQKQLTGTAVIDNIRSKNGAIALNGVYRFQGGHF